MASAAEIQAHYDIDNDFYRLFLDSTYRIYSCAVWDRADSLESAQVNKLARLARFAGVAAGGSVLDIGCGWGGMMKYCIDVNGASKATGLTLSKAQYRYVDQAKSPSMEVALCSWRDYPTASDRFDAIVSIGAFEHFASLADRRCGLQVGIYRDFFDTCRRLSTPGARLGLQTIVTVRNPNTPQSVRDARFLLSEIFQGTALPRVAEIEQASKGLYEEVESTMIGSDYARTLSYWQERLEGNDSLVVDRYGLEIFERYRHYFVAARRSFEDGYIDLRQMALRPVPEMPS